ncbi:hypothetical protein SK128_024337 [Halocaridina rubra]|uniref:Uncharacterized protein n=1 Tax=Halocaridina rubra TaxID=373956 RepID=A0AAN8ZTA0_HALRR
MVQLALQSNVSLLASNIPGVLGKRPSLGRGPHWATQESPRLPTLIPHYTHPTGASAAAFLHLIKSFEESKHFDATRRWEEGEARRLEEDNIRRHEEEARHH